MIRTSWRALCAGLLLACAAHAQISFGPASSIVVGADPDAVATGDFDGDGLPDFAVTVDAPNRVDVYFGNGDGTFALGAGILTGGGTGPGHLAAADLNGDGDLDIAVALHNANSVMVILNQGGGVFAAGATFGVGADPEELAAADFDGDGSVDVASANRDSSDVSVLLNDGTGSFGPAATVAVGADPRGITAGDLDDDGDVDLATPDHDDRTVSILSNDGAGGFTRTATLSTGTQLRPEGITSADLNGDLSMDLAASTSGNGLNRVTVYLNNGVGGFGGAVHYAIGGVDPDGIIAADLDCDGDADLATANQTSNNLSAVPNNGNGTFGASTESAVGTNPDQLATADFDGDGGLDLINVNQDAGSVSVLLNESAGCAVPAIPCEDVRRLRARCSPNGRLVAVVRMTDALHDGEQVTLAINGVPHVATIVGNIARVILTNQTGPQTVELIDPPGCVDPVVTDCP